VRRRRILPCGETAAGDRCIGRGEHLEISARDAIEGKKHHLEEVNSGLRESDKGVKLEDPELTIKSKVELSRILHQTKTEKEKRRQRLSGLENAASEPADRPSVCPFISHARVLLSRYSNRL
jgi:hypothetical protein